MPIDPLSIAATAGTWFWEKFGDKATEKGANLLKKAWSKRTWIEKELLYKKRLIDLHSTTKLLGNPKEIKIDRIYTDVYALDQISAFRRLKIDEKSKGLIEYNGLPASTPRFPLLEIIKEKKRVYILGKPGAGKSTFLKIVCLLSCTGRLDRTPILIPLKQWNDSGVDLISFIDREFDVCQFPKATDFIKKLLESGEAILLLDGLDEIPQDNNARQRAIDALTDFSRKYNDVQIVLTCRIAATEYSFDRFDYFEIADFTKEQQLDFINKWYGDSNHSGVSFQKQWMLPENVPLRELAKTPLLLALLCLAFDETLMVPKRRVELYQEATNALLRKWDSSRGIQRDNLYKSLSPIRREQLLSRLASTTFFAGKIFFDEIAAADIVEKFLSHLPPTDESRNYDPLDVIRAIEAQHGLLVERAMKIYSFSHLTIQEYLTARFLVENSHSGVLNQKIEKHLSDDRWREVFLLVTSLLDDGDPFFRAVGQFFDKKFFADPHLLALFQRAVAHSASALSRRGDSASSLPAPASRDAAFAKAQDMCLSLASQFHFLKCGHQAAWRVRNVISYMDSMSPVTASIFPTSTSSIDLFLKYLRALNVVIESVQLASLSDREKIIDRLIFPITKSPFLSAGAMSRNQ